MNNVDPPQLAPRRVRHIRTTLITALQTALKFELVSQYVAKLVDLKSLLDWSDYLVVTQRPAKFREIKESFEGERMDLTRIEFD